LSEVVEQAPWRGHKDIDARSEGLMLAAITDAAKDHSNLQIGKAG